MALIAFDWNGTLKDDIAPWAAAYNAALAVLGIPEQPLEVLQEKFDVPTKLAITNFGVDDATYAARQADLYAAFSKAHKACPHAPVLRKGAASTLAALTRAGHECILLSNHDQSGLEREVVTYDLGHAFALVSGNAEHGTIRVAATKQDRLVAIMNQRAVPAAHVVIVGDAREEARIAKALGITGIGISGGCSSRALMIQDGARHIVDDLEEIPAIVERVCGL